MKISGIEKAPSSIVNGFNEIGRRVSDAAKATGRFASEKADAFVKSEPIKNAIDKVDKKTFIGMGVVLAGIILAANCIKGIANKISELKED